MDVVAKHVEVVNKEERIYPNNQQPQLEVNPAALPIDIEVKQDDDDDDGDDDDISVMTKDCVVVTIDAEEEDVGEKKEQEEADEGKDDDKKAATSEFEDDLEKASDKSSINKEYGGASQNYDTFVFNIGTIETHFG
jgi:hypothetical protein